MADTLITGGLVVDGTGAAGEVRDVAIRDGRFVSPDELDVSATIIDADGMVVAPGFVDVHTHYDAQLSWDPTASPSPLHGVTTAIGGNCGFTLAPSGEDHADYLMKMMARVEGMPLAALSAGLSWDWSDYAGWSSQFEGNLGINAGFLTGHSTIRRVVMGEACHESASPEQIDAMARIVDESCRAGALGFSTSTSATHNDAEGDPVPSRGATNDELVTLAGAVRELPGTVLECILAGTLSGFTPEEIELMADMSLAGNRPINWNVLGVSAANPTGHEDQLAASDRAAERGARVVALTLPHSLSIRLNFMTGFVLDGLPGWSDVFKLDVDDRLAALCDPAVRSKMAAGAASEEAGLLRGLARWKGMEILEAFSEENKPFEGGTIAEVMSARGIEDPFDALCDFVVADGLRTGLRPGGMGAEREADWRLRGDVWRDSRTVVGGSDAGAHLDMMCGAVYSTALLAHGVREFGVVTMEEAIHQLADVPARLYGLVGRGRIADGYAADVVIFDADEVGYGSERTRDDLPGGAWRLYAEGHGVQRVIVNGETVVEDGVFAGVTPGTLLRSGTDTASVTL